VAVLRVLVRGESALVSKIDLAKDGARDTFVKTLVQRLPGVDSTEVESQLLRLCDDRAAWLQSADEAAAEKGTDPTIADLLVEIAFDEAELCHDKDQNAYATIQVADHCETWPVRSRGFRLWLRRRLREEQDRSAHSEAVSTAIEEIEAKALFDEPEVEVYVRIAEHDGAIWLDLADEAWRTVRITASGWQLVEDKPPVRFIRSRGMLPLPAPEHGGKVDDLRQFLNVKDDSDFVLIVSWLLACLRSRGPFPVLNVNGVQGSAKTTVERFLRGLIDPNSAPLRSEPREPRDLVISAANSWIIGYDNLSRISPWLSDALCRLSTGGGFATRQLYTDREEVIFESQRPVLFNGITELATRPDLLDRCLLITLTAIPEHHRKDEKALWKSFNAERPRILGALLRAVAAGLAHEHTVKPGHLPRMADFALWMCACEPGLDWPSGTFMNAYTANRASANDAAIEASVVGTAIQAFMTDRESWQGTAADLLGDLEEAVDDRTRHGKAWPKSPRKLSGDLRRVAPNLRATGIDVDFKKSGKRLVFLGRRTDGADGMGETQTTYGPGDKGLFDKDLQNAPDGMDGMDGVLHPFSEDGIDESDEVEL